MSTIFHKLFPWFITTGSVWKASFCTKIADNFLYAIAVFSSDAHVTDDESSCNYFTSLHSRVGNAVTSHVQQRSAVDIPGTAFAVNKKQKTKNDEKY